MKLWIIGKRGMLSRALQRLCKEKEIDYLVTSRKEVDVTDEASLKAQFDSLEITHVINCSGYTAVDRAEEESEKAEKLNIHAVESLGRLAKAKGIKLIHFSTDYVFSCCDPSSEPALKKSAFGPIGSCSYWEINLFSIGSRVSVFSANYVFQFFILILTYMILDFISLIGYAMLANKLITWLKANPRLINSISACVLIIIAIIIALTQQY